MSNVSQRLSQSQRLSLDPAFIDCIASGIKMAGLKATFPEYGETTIKEARRAVRARTFAPADTPAEAFETPLPKPEVEQDFSGDRYTLSLKAVPYKTPEEVIAYHEIDAGKWELTRFRVKAWEGYIKNKESEIETQALFSISAEFVLKKAVVSARAEIEALIEAAKEHAPKYSPLIRIPRVTPRHLLEISIPDLHMGKLAWGRECGEPYDLDIAERCFRCALYDLLQKTSTYEIDKILFVIGNDLLHVDGPHNQTYAGTPQDVDSRYQRTFLRTRLLMIEAIERMLPIADVDAVIVPGNHDKTAAFHLGDSLECWFHKCAQVKIDNEPTLRKYYRYGQVMLMLTHGDKGKRPDYANVAAAEQPEMWGQTRFRECHTGDKHQVRTEEQHGFRVRILPSLCAADSWHHEQQYVANLRSAEAYVWHPTEGLSGTATYNVPREQVTVN